MAKFVKKNVPRLLDDKKIAFNTILEAVTKNDNGGIYFLDATGSTGMTFPLNVLLAEVRKQRKIALAIASSGTVA